MEKGRNGWVTLGSRSRNRRQRSRKSSQQTEQNRSTKQDKQKQSANTPPPMAFPARERKVTEKSTFTSEQKEIGKILNRTIEISAKRALEPIATQVDPTPTHRSPMAVKTRDYPIKTFWKDPTKNENSKNIENVMPKDQASCDSSAASDCSSTKKTPSEIKSEIQIEWIFEQRKKRDGKFVSGGPASSTTPNATQVKYSWPIIKKAASMPNLNPNAPCFKANPFLRSSFKSFTPRAPQTLSWQSVSHQNIMPQWRGDYHHMLPSFSSPPAQVQHNDIRNVNRDLVSNLLVPYSCGPF